MAVPIVRPCDGEPSGGDLCAPQFVAQAARAHAGEVARVAPRGGRYLSHSVVPSAHVCLEGGSAIFPALLARMYVYWHHKFLEAGCVGCVCRFFCLCCAGVA